MVHNARPDPAHSDRNLSDWWPFAKVIDVVRDGESSAIQRRRCLPNCRCTYERGFALARRNNNDLCRVVCTRVSKFQGADRGSRRASAAHPPGFIFVCPSNGWLSLSLLPLTVPLAPRSHSETGSGSGSAKNSCERIMSRLTNVPCSFRESLWFGLDPPCNSGRLKMANWVGWIWNERVFEKLDQFSLESNFCDDLLVY